MMTTSTLNGSKHGIEIVKAVHYVKTLFEVSILKDNNVRSNITVDRKEINRHMQVQTIK